MSDQYFSCLKLSSEDCDAGYRLECLSNTPRFSAYVSWNPKTNEHLYSGSLDGQPCEYTFQYSGKYDIATLDQNMIGQVEDAMLEYVRKRNLFNGMLLGQTSSLYPDQHEVSVGKVDFFSYLMSDNVAFVCGKDPFKAICHNKMPAFNDGVLLPIPDSGCANIIGASTIAVTSDGFIVLNKQGMRSSSNPGMYAPSGSGSVEYSHFHMLATDAGNSDLFDVISFAAERELEEESGVSSDMIDTSCLLGFFRVLERNGKPEYICYTRLHATCKDIVERYELTEDETGFSEYPVFVPVSNTLSEALADFFCDVGEDVVSVQLLAAQRCFKQFNL